MNQKIETERSDRERTNARTSPPRQTPNPHPGPRALSPGLPRLMRALDRSKQFGGGGGGSGGGAGGDRALFRPARVDGATDDVEVSVQCRRLCGGEGDGPRGGNDGLTFARRWVAGALDVGADGEGDGCAVLAHLWRFVVVTVMRVLGDGRVEMK